MAEEDATITPEDAPGTSQSNGLNQEPEIGLIAQYTKDLSFENPNAPMVYQWQTAPQIEVQFNIGADRVGDDAFEVVLKIEVRATADGQTAFAVELLYGGLFGVRNVAEETLQPFLFAEAPRLMFPFARRVLADAVRDGNFPPLMLDPVDFTALYFQQAEQARELATGETLGQA